MKRLFILAALVSVTALAADKAAKPAETHVQPADLKWVQPFGPQAASFAFVVGQFGDKKPASFFIKLAPGMDSGWHTHDEDYSAVVIKGPFTAQQQGDAAETQLAVGSYFTQTGKKNHRNGCLKDGGECIVFVHFDKGANSHPMTAEGKPAPAPAADAKDKDAKPAK